MAGPPSASLASVAHMEGEVPEGDRRVYEAYQLLAKRTARPHATDIEEMVAFAMRATQSGHGNLAIALLEPLATQACQNGALWRALGLAYRQDHEMEAALEALKRARQCAPSDAVSAFAYAQVLFETARPAGEAFGIADALSPNQPDIILGHACALAGEGADEEACALLVDILSREPQWLDGHKGLAALRLAAGQRARFDESYVAATHACPHSLSLRLAHIHLLATARDWDGARAIHQKAVKDFGPKRGLEMARVHIASEGGEADGDNPDLFDGLADVRDAGLDICKVRHALRIGDPMRAQGICLSYWQTPMASLFWPYLSLAWRLLGDPRALWLDGTPPRIMTFDLGLKGKVLNDLVSCLKSLHVSNATFLEQSVHGGTQTGGHLFFRPLAPLQRLKHIIEAKVKAYIDRLDAPDPDHPLLGQRRDGPLRFEGAWSVRLKAGGHHSTHTHPKGWISSALYIDLPKTSTSGEAKEGWISFGDSPPELKLGLGPTHQIKPEVGKLVLFPSTLWHKTLPFSTGERLTIAFDVQVPKLRLMP